MSLVGRPVQRGPMSGGGGHIIERQGERRTTDGCCHSKGEHPET